MALCGLGGSAVIKLRQTPKSCRSLSWSQLPLCAAGTRDVNVIVSPEAAPRAVSWLLRPSGTLGASPGWVSLGDLQHCCSAAVPGLPKPNQSPSHSSSHETFPFGPDKAGQIQRCSRIPAHTYRPHGWSRKPFLCTVVICDC